MQKSNIKTETGRVLLVKVLIVFVGKPLKVVLALSVESLKGKAG